MERHGAYRRGNGVAREIGYVLLEENRQEGRRAGAQAVTDKNDLESLLREVQELPENFFFERLGAFHHSSVNRPALVELGLAVQVRENVFPGHGSANTEDDVLRLLVVRPIWQNPEKGDERWRVRGGEEHISPRLPQLRNHRAREAAASCL